MTREITVFYRFLTSVFARLRRCTPVILDAMSSRDERKQQTRQTLLQAALTLSLQGRSFASVSLREVTREAGVVPTAFYRHFSSMDELGVALVDEVCLHLRRLLRDERVKAQGAGHIALQRSVMLFLLYVQQESGRFEFLVRERLGGSPPVRQAIQQEIHHFVSDLANDFRLFPDMQNLPSSDLMMIAHLVINTAITLCGEILMVPADQTQLKYELGLQAVKQMRLIFVGAMHWQPEKGTQLSGRTAEVLSPGVAGPSA